jgi:hypothetical protein
MIEFLESLENSGFATWVREANTVLAYPTVLAFHTLGMLFLVGMNAAVDLRILGVAPGLPLGPMERFFRLMWLGFWINAVSGVVLLSLTPITFLTTPVFYIKLTAIALAVVNLRMLRRRVFGNAANLGTKPVLAEGKILACTSLAFWTVAIFTGRVTAYSGYVQRQTALGLLIVTAVVLLARSIAPRLRSLMGWSKPLRQGV